MSENAYMAKKLRFIRMLEGGHLLRVFFVAVVILSLGSPVFSYDRSTLKDPIALKTKVHVGEASDEYYWLSGFSSDDGGVPDVLSVIWSKSALGWFGSTWKLQLVTAHDLFPPGMGVPGEGYLEGQIVHELVTMEPKRGHTYDISMSFDAARGVVSILIKDEANEAKAILNQGIQINGFVDDVYPAVEFLNTQNRDAVLSDLKVMDQFTPHGVRWNLSRVFSDGVLRPRYDIDRRETLNLHVVMPWDRLPGEFALSITDGVTDRKLVAHPAEKRDFVTELPSLSHLKAGDYEVRLDYVVEDTVVNIGSSPIPVGRVEAYVDQVKVQYVNEEMKLSGHLVISSDGLLPATTIGLNVSLNEVVLDSTSEPHFYTISRGPSIYGKPIFTETFAEINLDPIRIEFDAILDAELESDWPYRLWDVVLEPVVESPFTVDFRAHEERIRIASNEKWNASDMLRVMTYNVHAGYGMDEVLDLQRIADVIAYSGADIVGLQEIDVETSRSDGENQAAILADMLDMEYYFGDNLFFQRGSHGNLILSRYPLISADNTFLPYRNTSQRGLLRARVDFNGTPISVFVTHLGFEEDNIMQRDRILEDLYKVDEPFILLGDFNMDPLRPGSALNDSILNMPHPVDPRKITARNIFDPLVRDAWLEFKSFPGNENPRGIHHGFGRTLNTGRSRIDYVFISDEFEVVNDEEGVFMIESIASDHLPVVSTIRISDEEN